MRILHIDTELTWRGGQNQLLLLLENASPQVEFHIACPPHSRLAQRLGERWPQIPIASRSLGYLSSARRLIRYCRRHRIQILDCQSSKAHTLGLLVKRRLPDLKLVIHRRVDYAPTGKWLNRKKYHSSMIDAYIAISQCIADILIRADIAANKIFVARSAVDPKRFTDINAEDAKARVCSELGLDAQKPILINVAYHTDQKGIPTLIKAAGLLKDRGLAPQILLAGDGPLHAAMQDLARKLELEGSVHFLGVRQDVDLLLKAADILAFPSNFEGLGTTILDAIHCDCAVAATRVGGIPEMIVAEETGLLSEVGDAKGHAENLQRLIESQDLRLKLTRAAKARIEKDFSLSSMVEGNLTIYRNLLNKQHTQER